MTKIVAMLGLASLVTLGALQGCSDDDPAPAGGAGSGNTAGTGAGGSTAGAGGATAGAGGSTAGAGGSDAGAGGAAAGAGGGSEETYCGAKESEIPPLPKCGDENASDCTKAMCADTTSDLKCKEKWEACEADPGCNKGVACFAVCSAAGESGAVGICSPLAGTGLGKALPLQDCQKKLAACGGDGSIGGGAAGAAGAGGSN